MVNYRTSSTSLPIKCRILETEYQLFMGSVFGGGGGLQNGSGGGGQSLPLQKKGLGLGGGGGGGVLR